VVPELEFGHQAKRVTVGIGLGDDFNGYLFLSDGMHAKNNLALLEGVVQDVLVER